MYRYWTFIIKINECFICDFITIPSPDYCGTHRNVFLLQYSTVTCITSLECNIQHMFKMIYIAKIVFIFKVQHLVKSRYSNDVEEQYVIFYKMFPEPMILYNICLHTENCKPVHWVKRRYESTKNILCWSLINHILIGVFPLPSEMNAWGFVHRMYHIAMEN